MPGRDYVRIALLVLGIAAVPTKSSWSGNPLDDTADKTARAARLEEMRILAAKRFSTHHRSSPLRSSGDLHGE